MRPVDKKAVGSTVSIDGVDRYVQRDYRPYNEAKPLLLANLDKYCSYCEAAVVTRDMHVEHVQPKSLPKYSGLATKWDNFLLSCSVCNGRGNKGDNDVVLSEFHLPHLNNTFLSLSYLKGGVIEVNRQLTGVSRDHAENLWRLVGFDKKPSECTPTDDRWKKRLEVWNLAEKYREKYTHNQDVDMVIDLAKGYGHWSIWFTVFAGYDEVRRALIERFAGTSIQCFDPTDHYNPVCRNIGKADPI